MREMAIDNLPKKVWKLCSTGVYRDLNKFEHVWTCFYIPCTFDENTDATFYWFFK